jgi:hypothetical protein
MKLVQRMIPIRNRLFSLSDRFGVPQHFDVILLTGSSQTQILPRPLVNEIDPRIINEFMADQVDVGIDDYYVKGIPRTYDEQVLSVSQYLIKATQANNGTWVGIKCDCIWLKRSDLVTYDCILKAQRNR